MAENNNIYKLGLFGTMFIRAMSKQVTRVPGGWIFEDWDDRIGRPYNPIFVPFNNEFQKMLEKEETYG